MRRLFLLRHAKAESKSIGNGDRDRPLAPRGHRQATAMGAFFKKHGFDPVSILCSSALRTRETLASMKAGLPRFSDASYLDQLYSASPDILVRTLEQEVVEEGDVLLVGHNPEIGMLVQLLSLSQREHEQQAVKALKIGYQTCALTIFETGDVQAGAFARPVWRLVGYFRPEE